MRNKRSTVGRFATVLVLSGAIVAGTYAFTAANTVPDSKAGDGAGAVTGYVLSTVHYNLNVADPSTIDAVTFTLDSAPVAGSTIRAQLDPAGNWYACTNVAAAVTCTTTGEAVLTATSLRVVVAD
jgi:hypothetical protein